MSSQRSSSKNIPATQDPFYISDSESNASFWSSQIVSNKPLPRAGSRSVVSIDLTSDDPPSRSTIKSIKTPYRPTLQSASTTSSASTNASTDLTSPFDEDEDPKEQPSPLSPPEEPEESISYDAHSRASLRARKRGFTSRGKEPWSKKQRDESIQDDYCDPDSPLEKRGLRMKNASTKAAGKIKSPQFGSSLPIRGINEPTEEMLPRTRSAQTSLVNDGKDAPSPQHSQVQRRSPRSSVERCEKTLSQPRGNRTEDGSSISTGSESSFSQPVGTDTEDEPSIHIESEEHSPPPKCGSTSSPDGTESSEFTPVFTRYKKEKTRREINATIYKYLSQKFNQKKILNNERPVLGWVYIFISPKHASGRVKIGKAKDEPGKRKKDWYKIFPLQESKEGYRNAYSYFDRVESLIRYELHNERRQFNCVNVKCNINSHAHAEWFEISEQKAAQSIEKWRRWVMEYEPFGSTGSLTPYWNRRVMNLPKILDDVNWDAWLIPSSDGYWTSDYLAYWSERYVFMTPKKLLDQKIPKIWVLIFHILLWYDGLIGIIAGIAGLIWL
ncbi:hypothetical protein BGZ60DRAFT_528496 [Tricladium varicosporioides]|nr:hypothetical protein BGZ60DRAFT_528496 [Hymenoscyphus varicosporioides]